MDLRTRAAALSAVVFVVPLVLVLLLAPDPLEQPLGVDYHLYRDVTARWLAGGPYFEPYQLAGPYEIRAGDVLYPPVALLLFAPFGAATSQPMATILAIAWWAIPLGITVAAVVRLRPRPEVWPLLALCLNPTTLLKIWTGNPVIWPMAALAVAVASRWRVTAPFVLLKPSLAPFALFGIRRRSWWVGLAALVVLSLPFGALWADWVASVANSRGGGLLYSALEFPMLLLPLVAYAGRTRREGTTSAVAGRPLSP